MNFYDDLVMQTQMNYSKYYPIYASGSTPYQLTDKKPLPYSEQIDRLVQEIKEADCVVVAEPPVCPLPAAEIFTTRTTTPTANTSGLLLRSTTSKVLLQGWVTTGRPGKSIGGISPPSFTPPRPHLCVIPI